MEKLFQSFGKFFIYVIIALLILSFTIWGVGDVLNLGGGKISAKIGDVKIYEQQLDRIFESEKKKLLELMPDAPEEQVEQLIPRGRILQILINRALLEAEVKSLGVQISDDDLLEEIRRDERFKRAGQFSKQALEEYIFNTRQREQDFFKSYRQDLQISFLIDSFVGSYPRILQSQSDIVHNFLAETRDVAFVKIPSPSPIRETFSDSNSGGLGFGGLGSPHSGLGGFGADMPQPTESDIISYYEANKQKYYASEYRYASYVKIDESSVKTELKITEEEVAKNYQENKEQYKTEEEVKLYQIVVAEQDRAMQIARGLAKYMQDKQDKHSDAKSNKQDKGDIAEAQTAGSVLKEGDWQGGVGELTVQEFLHYARNLSANSMGVQNAKGKEDKGDEGNTEDAGNVEGEGDAENAGNTDNTEDSESFLGSFSKQALEKTELFLQADIEEIFSLKQGQVTSIMPSPFGYHIFFIAGKKGVGYIPYKEVSSEIRQELYENKREEVLYQKSEELLDLVASGVAFADGASELNLELEEIEGLTQAGKFKYTSYLREIPQFQGFIEAIFRIEEQDKIELLTDFGEDGNLSYYLLKLNKIEDRRLKSLDEVRGKIIANWQADYQFKLTKERAEEVAEYIKLYKTQQTAETQDILGAIEDYANASDYIFKYVESVYRNPDNIANKGKGVFFSRALIEDIFNKSVGGVTDVYEQEDASYIVAYIAGINSANPDDIILSLKQVELQMQDEAKNDTLEYYINSLYQKHKVEIK